MATTPTGIPNKLYCFSPAVMLATYCIEIFGAAFVFARYRPSPARQLMIALLLGLGLFQLAEYNVCVGAFGFSSLDWARIGFASITLLPPLGLHLGMVTAGRKSPKLTGFAYASGLAFALFFLLSGHGMDSQICGGNYVIFTLHKYVAPLFSLYYYGWLLVSVGLAWRWSKTMANAKHKRALRALMMGYAAFIMPTIFANVLRPETVAGIPSIMCGFAVILALVLIFVVAPDVLTPRRAVRKP